MYRLEQRWSLSVCLWVSVPGTASAELVWCKTHRGTKNMPVRSHSGPLSAFLMLLASVLPAHPQETSLLLLPITPGPGRSSQRMRGGGRRGAPPGGEMEMEMLWTCFPFPAGTTTRAGAAVGYGYEHLSRAEDGGEADWKT